MAADEIGTRRDGLAASGDPRARFSIAPRELVLGLVVLGVGAFMITAWLLHPDGHTWRRAAIGGAAVLVGGAVAFLSLGRSCSACGQRLQNFSFRTTVGMMLGVEEALLGGEREKAARVLGGALTTPAGEGARAFSLWYCDGCRELLTIRVSGDGGDARQSVVRGPAAAAVVPVIEGIAASGGAGA